MKKVTFAFIPFLSLLLTSCGGGDAELDAYSKKLNVDLNKGEIVFYEDNHGGFLGDGYMLCICQYLNNDVEIQISKSNKFHEYPLPENLQTFLFNPIDSNIVVSDFQNGYYYFENRHPNCKDKYSDSELFDQVSFNFSFVLYNCDTDFAYICDYDT